jgi:hypothetical protein
MLAIVTGVAGLAIRRIRDIEVIMPDQVAES